jgi:hypothetical protein
MANVLSVDIGLRKHYKHSGFSATITDSYTSSSGTIDIAWDGTNVVSANQIADKHYKHSGFSNTITSSYASPANYPTGLDWDGTNVISADYTTVKHYKHSGFSSTITDSYQNSTGGAETGIAWDGTNVISIDGLVGKHYKHYGFSNLISNSYSSPAGAPRGIAWDGTNALSTDITAEKHYKHSGFSSTITDSYSSPSWNPWGIGWDGAGGAPTYYASLTLTQNLTIVPDKIPLSTTYTTIPIVRKRLKNIDTDITDTDIEQYIWEAEGLIDATMKDSFLTIFTATKHDLIRACATDLAALQVLTYDPTVHPTIEAAAMTADLLLASTKDALIMLSNPRNVKYWKSL